ncbi:MAG: VPLPA-CTERM-specific exosortase XrtD [Gammaproteobacteria bacterium]
MSSSTAASQSALREPVPGNLLVVVALIAVTAVALGVLFWDGLDNMYTRWYDPEYNHGFMIPLVAIYLLWLRAREITAASLSGSWLGLGLLLVSLALLFLGDRSAVYAIAQYAFVLSLWALVYAASGARGISLMWVPLLYLAFMVPLPDFVTQKLTASLQLMSSQIGVAVIRAAGLSVFLEGNVIDLGAYQLQVAEACSGMRYLFPLLSFGFLCAVLFRGRWWQRGILLVSTIPITIFMNSFRIGVIGIMVNYFGIEQAEGFLHDFEGWVVFMASVGVLFTEVWIFARMEGRPFLEIFGLDIPDTRDMVNLLGTIRPNRVLYAAVAILVVTAAVSLTVSRPPTLLPERSRLATFPLRVGEFEGRETFIDQVYLDTLRVSDYLMSVYKRPADPAPVELWVAYYDSQVKGASVHSPQACLPGGGWRIDSFGEHEVTGVLPDGGSIRVNRVEIALGDQRQLVYYWFAQRGRVLTNEYLVKWFIFWDGLFDNRTDGALVRMSTYVGDKSAMAEADERLASFVRASDPKLAYHLPGANAVLREATAEQLADFDAKAAAARRLTQDTED